MGNRWNFNDSLLFFYSCPSFFIRYPVAALPLASSLNSLFGTSHTMMSIISIHGQPS
jgi:hypothetical protein